MAGSREEYEASVRRLRYLWADLSQTQWDIESIARKLVSERNKLKVEFRAGLDPTLSKLIEERNQAKYGDPIGPTADNLYLKYGTWEAVADAALRPADLKKGQF